MAARLNISESHKFVFYAPPRCGARYLCQVLGQLGLVGGTGRPGFATSVSHLCAPPPGPEYSVVLAVRNPYTRVLSCWAWARIIKQVRNDLPFDEFVYKYSIAWARQLTDYLGPNRRYVNHLIHLERCQEDILNLPFCDRKIDFPGNGYKSDYRKSGKNWKEYYTTGTRRFVAQNWDGDFELGGYDPEEWL